MAKYEIKEVNTQTGEEIVRAATASEVKQIEADQAQSVAFETELQAKLSAKSQLLERLGITAEEAALLLS